MSAWTIQPSGRLSQAESRCQHLRHSLSAGKHWPSGLWRRWGGLRAMAHCKDSHAHSKSSLHATCSSVQVARLDAATLHTNVRSMFGLQVVELVGLQPCCLDSPHHPHELDVCTPASSPLDICLDLSLHLPPKAGKQRGWCHCRCLLHLFDCVYFPFLFLLLLLLVHHSAQAVSIRMADDDGRNGEKSIGLTISGFGSAQGSFVLAARP